MQKKRGGGGCTTTAILKLVWLAAAALFLVSISVSMKLTNDKYNHSAASASASSLENQLQLPRKQRDSLRRPRRNQETNLEVKNADKKPSTTTTTNSASSDDSILMKWLRQRQNATSTTTDNSDISLAQLLSPPLHFTPGTLPLSQLSTLQYCYTDPTIYRQHFKEKPTRRIPHSEQHNLAYIMLPKSGSSTGRLMMKHEFDAVERNVKIEKPLNVVAFVREPLSRFYSQYDEAYVRTAPWNKMQNPYYADSSSGNHLVLAHPFPYLYENMKSYHDYEDVFCPPSTRTHRRECIYRESHEDGTLARRLERFVNDYNGREPFDIHMALQVPMLSDVKTGRALHISELYNTTNSEEDWNAIAKHYLGEEAVLENAKQNKMKNTKESGGVIQGRSFPRRFDKSLVGPAAERRICHLALLEYCCLNFPLPSVCSEGEGDGGKQHLTCKMDYDEQNKRIRIQPGQFPDKAR